MVDWICSILASLNVYTVLVGLNVFLLLVYWRCKTEREGIPPGPPFLPILGNLLDMRGEYLHYKHLYFAQLQQQYGSVFRIYFGSQLMIMLNDFESIDEAFVKQKYIFSTRPVEQLWGLKQSVKNGTGVIWSNGERWKINRRLSTQSLRNLGAGKLGMEARILEEADFMMETFPVDEPFSIQLTLMRATTNIIGTVVFGQRWEYQDQHIANIITLIAAAFKSEGPLSPIHEFPSLRFLPPLAKTMSTFQRSISKIRAQIEEEVMKHDETFVSGKVRDFIDVVLTQLGKNPDVDKESLKRTAMDLFFAGADTTANTLDYALYYMLLYPEILKRCQDDIDKVVGSSRRVEMNDRPTLPFVEATLMEVLRLGSISPFPLVRTPIQDTKVGGYVIPKGCLVIPNIYNCHRDPKHWSEPLRFYPQRFLDEDGKLMKPPPVFMPFSTGPRICAGDILAKMEIFLFFTSIIQRYDITKGNPDDELRTDGITGISRSPHPYKLRVSLRK